MKAIEAVNLFKTYRMYRKPVHRLRELLLKGKHHTEFSALNNLTIHVDKGETLGIIGENGAGKSTLLKIFAKTLAPTSGTLHIDGRVSSLLELGSGFHPEFTGIENIFFYGALLGMDRTMMKQKVEEIVDFAEIGDFVNMPIKTYSSGMYVRLAFSVATAIDPDILIVDEALSVGDLHFQKKSTDRILSFKERGKTIVFCSHTMYHVGRLCDRVIWLQNGSIHLEGKPFDVIQAYEHYQLEDRAMLEAKVSETNDRDPASPKSLIFIEDIENTPAQVVRSNTDLKATIRTVTQNDSIPYQVAVKIRRVDGLDIIGIGTQNIGPFYGNQTVTVKFPSIQLKEGLFFIEAFVFDKDFVHIFDRKETEPFNVPKESLELGIVNLPHEWSVE